MLLPSAQLSPRDSEFSVHVLLQQKVPKNRLPNLQGLLITPVAPTPVL